MDYFTHVANSLAAMQSRMADTCPTVGWHGTECPIIPGTAMRRRDLVAGGFDLNSDFRFQALVSTFGSDASTAKTAMLQTVVRYLGDDYKIVSVNIQAGGLTLSVECNSLFQSA